MHALKPCIHIELVNIALKFKRQFLTMLFHRFWNEDAEAQNEKLRFNGTIINLSDRQIDGTAELSRGVWIREPQFPIPSPGYTVFKSKGVSLSEYIYKNV